MRHYGLSSENDRQISDITSFNLCVTCYVPENNPQLLEGHNHKNMTTSKEYTVLCMFDKKSKVPQFFVSSMSKFSRDVTSLKIIIFSGVIVICQTQWYLLRYKEKPDIFPSTLKWNSAGRD